MKESLDPNQTACTKQICTSAGLTGESLLSEKRKLAVCLISTFVMDRKGQTYYRSVCVLLFVTLVLKILRRQCQTHCM